MFVVDTDVMVDVLRRYPPAVEWLNALGRQVFIIPGLVVMELLQGCRNRAETDRLLEWISDHEIRWPTERDCHRALADFAFRRLNRKLAIPDALIAECAVGLGLPLYTFNVKHFSGIPGLRTIQPYRKQAR